MIAVLSPAPTGVDTYITTGSDCGMSRIPFDLQAGAYQPPFPGLERRDHGRSARMG